MEAFCINCNTKFEVKRSRYERLNGKLCCSKQCLSQIRIRKNEEKITEKIRQLGERFCVCGCGTAIKAFYRPGQGVIFNDYILGHNLDERNLLKAHNASKEICSQRMKELNRSMTLEQRRSMGLKSGTVRKEQIKNETFIVWSQGKTKYTDGRLLSASIKNTGKTAWNRNKSKFTDPRIQKYGLKLKGRTKATGYLSAIKSSERMIRNNPMKNMGVREKALKHNILSPNKAEKTIIERNFPKLEFTGNHSFWVTFKNKTFKNPDFIVRPFHEHKKVVEVWGEYWHRNEDPSDLIKKYSEVGIHCLIVPYKTIKNGTYENVVKDFICI